MKQARPRFTLPTSLVVTTLAAAAPLGACAPRPAPVDADYDAPDDVAAPTDASADTCTLTGCVGGPIALCAPDDAQTLSCQGSGNCVQVYTTEHVLIGMQCYGSCVTSTLADGSSLTGFC